jgi:AcrR family transcriptional regulator
MSNRPRRPLTRERIVDVAIKLADRNGLDAFSMRKVAAGLGCEVMSLYNHVDGKEDLLDEMIDQVYSDLGVPADDVTWAEALRLMAVATRARLAEHPWACDVLTGRFPGPARRRHQEAMLRILARAGLPEHVADLGFHAVTVHVQGFTQQQLAFERGADGFTRAAERYLAEAPADESPYLVAHFQYHAEHGHERDDFLFVLDLILDGLELGMHEP